MTLIAVVSGLVLLWYLMRAVERDRLRRARAAVWERRDCGYADTPQGMEAASFQRWETEVGE